MLGVPGGGRTWGGAGKEKRKVPLQLHSVILENGNVIVILRLTQTKPSTIINISISAGTH